MFEFMLLATTTIVVLTGLTILCAVVTRDPALAPATVNPFSPVRTDPSAETLAAGMSTSATLAGDWQTVELATLTQVEDMLDWLENHNVVARDVQLADGKFVIRWR